MKKALISGITGQTGSYLAELLLEKGYEVHGIIRRSSSINTDRIDHIFNDLYLHYGDMTDGMGLINILKGVEPDEVYNLAAQSHVNVSFEMPEYTMNADMIGAARLLEIIRGDMPDTKYYQASTSEMFGSSPAPQSETTKFQPCSPYGSAKLAAYWMTRNYREAYGLYAVNGILFNHESPRRGETFVTRKITRWVAKYKAFRGNCEPLQIGNVWAVRDWSHAKDMVKGIHQMMNRDVPQDFVLGSGEGHTVKEFIDKTFECANLGPIEWTFTETGKARGYYKGEKIIESVDRYYRPLEVNELIADTTQANVLLGWKPTYTFDDLVSEMFEHDYKELYPK